MIFRGKNSLSDLNTSFTYGSAAIQVTGVWSLVTVSRILAPPVSPLDWKQRLQKAVFSALSAGRDAQAGAHAMNNPILEVRHPACERNVRFQLTR